jgi:hypothetical protein
MRLCVVFARIVTGDLYLFISFLGGLSQAFGSLSVIIVLYESIMVA